MDNTRDLHLLIDRVEQAAASERNLRRGKKAPAIGVGTEDPIIWTILFGFDANRYFSDPLFYAEQTLRQKLWRFENIDDDTPLTLDLPAWLGHYPEYTFVGLEVRFTEKGIPLLQEDHPLTRDPDLRLLRPVDFETSGWMERARRWYEEITRLVAGRLRVHFITWNRGCLDLAIQLRGFENFLTDTVERPEFVHGLMRYLVEQRYRWLCDRARYLGEEAPKTTWIADDWINIPFISPAMFRDFVLPYYLEIERQHGAIGGIHSCGNQAPVQQYLLQVKTLPYLEVSPWTDLLQTLLNVPPDKTLGISLHPNDVLASSPAEMRAKLQFIADSCRGRRIGVGTSGLTPIFDDPAEFNRRIDTWLGIAREVFGH
jgi:hypothetical protein